MNFAERLGELMKEFGITSYRLAKEIGCTTTSVTNWLSGKDVSKTYITRMADYFQVSIDYLLGETDIKKAPTQEGERELPHAKYREILAEGGIRLMLDADAKVPQEHLDDIIEFIKFKQRKNGR